MSGMTRAEDLTSPPPDFAVYGLDSGYDGERWLDFFESQLGAPAWALWLGHRVGDGGVLVGTMPRSRFDEGHCAPGTDCLAEVAFVAAFKAINLGLPNPQVPSPDKMGVIWVDHALENARKYADWSTVSWSVDDVAVSAPVWSFADVWAGFTNALADAYVVVVGTGLAPDGLRLMRIPDGTAYGVDLSRDLDLAKIRDSDFPKPNSVKFHADQIALFSDAGKPRNKNIY